MAGRGKAIRGAVLALALLGALAGAGIARAQDEEPCLRDDIDCTTAREVGSGGGGSSWRCTGPWTIGGIWHVGGGQCAEGQITLDCDGNVVERHAFAIGSDLCPTANRAWAETCTEPGSGFGATDGGVCRMKDYYGNVIEMVIRVPPHEFRIAPYPLGLVAREDPLGEFHPSARLEWLPPPWPVYRDSGWRLWTWGNSRGPGSAPVFPCNMDENALLSNSVPAGTTCLRLQLWAAPAFVGADLTPAMAPGRLLVDALRMDRDLWPNQRVDLNFPYASHPATGKVITVEIGGLEVPAFPIYFQRWWPVRLRKDVKKVKDITEETVKCEPVPDANGDGEPDRGGDCWTTITIGNSSVQWPGDKKTETRVVGKEWETGSTDGVLYLTQEPFHRRYDMLHPKRAVIRAPGRTVAWGAVIWRGVPWLPLHLAVREAQGVVCANPGCAGEEPPLP